MSLFEHGAQQLCRLASSLGVPDAEQPRLLEVFSELSRTWGSRSRAAAPRWSGVTDDCSPYEFSVGFSREGAELRMLTEAQSDPATPGGYYASSLALSRVLAERFGAHLAPLERVAELFAPHRPVWFVAMHGVVLWPGPRPLLKIYLNPAARGPSLAPKLVESALARLELGQAWPHIQKRLGREDSLQFLALDLAAGAEARVKVYVRHRGASPAGLAAILAETDPDTAALIPALCRAIFGREVERLPRPAITMYTLRGGDDRPRHGAVHLPSYPFAGADRAICERVSAFLEEQGIGPRLYRRAVSALTGGRLEEPSGIHNYFSLQTRGGARRLTAYLCPRVYLPRLGPIGYDPVSAWPSPLPASVGRGL